MKRFLTLFMVLCLIFTAIAFASCGGGNDTDTNTDTNTDTDTSTNTVTDTNTDTDVEKEATYVITLKDQEGSVIANVTVQILNEYDEEIECLTTDENGQVTITLPIDESYFADIFELPEGYLDLAGKVRLENKDTVIEVENNIPNGTELRPYPVEDTNEITLGANEAVYYVSYGGGRNLLVENAQGLKLTYGSEEPREADENGKIEFKMPVSEDLYDRATRIKLENTTSEEKTYILTIYSDKGELDNPYDVVLDELTKITVEKEKTVYYKYVAESDGMLVVYSETEGNNIYCYNTTTYVTSAYTNGTVCEYIYASKGDEVMFYVSSNASKNYNSVEFKVNQYAGTVEEPVPLYKEATSVMLKSSQALTFTVSLEEARELVIEGNGIKLTMNETETLPSEDGIINGILINGTKTFTITNTSTDEKQTVAISLVPLDLPEE